MKFLFAKHTCISNLSVQKSFTIFFFLFRATLAAYGSSQATGSNRSCRCQPTLQPQWHRIQAMSVTYTPARENSGSLTHWASPGIELVSSQILVGFVNRWATTGTLSFTINWANFPGLKYFNICSVHFYQEKKLHYRLEQNRPQS